MLLTAASVSSSPAAESVTGPLSETIRLSLMFSVVGMSIVFGGLIVLLFTMKLLNLFFNSDDSGKTDSSEGGAADSNKARLDSLPDDVREAELNAACLGLSLYMYKKKYDEARQFILTGKSKERPNKPWSMSGRLMETSRDVRRFEAILSPSSVKGFPNTGKSK